MAITAWLLEGSRSNRRALCLLLKAFQEGNWAKEFLDGVLYCNTVKYYRDLKDGDEREGTVVIPGGKNMGVELKVGSYIIPGEDVVEVTHQPDLVSGANVFCMYCWAPPFVDDKWISLDKPSQLGSLRTLGQKYGSHAVVLKNVSEFIKRVDQAVRQCESIVKAKSGLVRYELSRVFLTIHKHLMLRFTKMFRFPTNKNTDLRFWLTKNQGHSS